MKKTIFLTLMLALVSLGTMAMSRSKVRNHARYLTDRMAYELDFYELVLYLEDHRKEYVNFILTGEA